MTAIRLENSSRPESVLHMAMELGEQKWKLAPGVGIAQKPRRRKITWYRTPANSIRNGLAIPPSFFEPSQSTTYSLFRL